MNKDWTGDKKSIFQMLGARNYAKNEREPNDYYATEPKALELLLEKEKFNNNVWECACGEGHLSKVLTKHGYNVFSSDLINRGYGIQLDFLDYKNPWCGDIITNPPYKYSLEFVEHSLELINDGARAAMFLKIQFLEGKRRREFFEMFPPKIIYVPSGRLNCALNGDFEKYGKSSASMYSWFIWEKGFFGDPKIRWFN